MASDRLPRISGKLLEPYGDKTIIGYCRCGAKWAGENLCHCATCHLTFMSVTGFDAHRDRLAIQCRTEDELRKRGYEPNPQGHWRRPRPEESIPRAGA